MNLKKQNFKKANNNENIKINNFSFIINIRKL